MNYLSFSLWGDNPLYNVGAIRNAQLCKSIYPNWKMVLYYDTSVPNQTIEELTKLDVELVNCTGNKINPYFWRFLTIEKEDSEFVCFRDCDSRINKREYSAVLEWIKSKKTLHVMRDHPYHSIPAGNDEIGILAGMWGIKGKSLSIRSLILDFLKDKKDYYGIDQTFLKFVYKKFEFDKIEHDEFFFGLPFPINREGNRFIGERIGVDEKPLNLDYTLLI